MDTMAEVIDMAAPTIRVYQRELPLQGFVAIDVRPEHRLFRRRYHGTVVVERRSESRSLADRPPTVAHAWGRSIDSVLDQLLPAAESDTAIAAALVRQQHHAGPASPPVPGGRH